jgi:hypothetical protein
MGSTFDRALEAEEKTRVEPLPHYEGNTTYPPIPHHPVNLREIYWDLRECLNRLEAINHVSGD